MPVLPKHHAPLRLATAYILLSPDHLGELHGAEGITYVINDAADVTNNHSVSTKVDATALIRAFANDNADHSVLPYEGFFSCTVNQHVLYVRRGTPLCSGVLVRWRWGGAPMLFGDLAPLLMEDNVPEGLV